MEDLKVRITAYSYDRDVIAEAMQRVVDALISLGCHVHGSVALPIRKRRFCVLRSPHVNKSSREQFEIRLYKQLIDVTLNSVEALSFISKVKMPEGACFYVKVI